jgi:metallo-beta-lactamase family protein
MKGAVSLRFIGAYAGVTGSKTLIQHQGASYLVDCGLFQGPKEVKLQNWETFPVDATHIDAVFLTHAHLDHVGYLPRLYRQGFRGPIWCSEGTQALAEIILMDSAFLEEELADYARRTGYSHYDNPQPLFTTKDAEAVVKLFRPLARQEWQDVGPGLSLRLVRSGHIIGSSFVQLMFKQDQKSKIITFSGDVGHNRSMILKGPEPIRNTDVLILESTYGDRLHPEEDAETLLGRYLERALGRSGVVVIPAFAVGRSQEVVFMIGHLERKGLIPKVPVFLDSPMSKKALQVFFSREEDQTVRSCFRGDPNDFFPEKFEIIESADHSMLATMMEGPAIVVSASGMLSGGRVMHHLKHRLPDPRNMVIFTGYQAEGTKGRFLQDNSSSLKSLRIHHQEVEVAAEVVTVDHLSSHADYKELIAWLKQIEQGPEQVLLNHGNPHAQEALAERIQQSFHWPATPASRQQIWHFF